VTPAEFRALFPALRDSVWLDTPGAPPGAWPVTGALGAALEAWSTGEFAWADWDAAAARTREPFARLVGAETTGVAAVGSLAEAAATVAASLPPGRVVVAAEDFRSNRYPWHARHEVVAVPPRDGAARVEDLVAALDERTSLLTVSEVTTRDGHRLDLPALRAATDRVGARLFVNLTQSLGALYFDAEAVRPDYLAVHGYKWLLCPRGAAWLVARPDRVGELKPLAPNWHSGPAPYELFGGPVKLAPGAARCDASPAWFSWVGASAALPVFLSLDRVAVEKHCLHLAGQLSEEAARLGFPPVAEVNPSPIVVLRAEHAERVINALRTRGVRATALGDRIRFGVHFFNNEADIDATLRALRAAG
jgi:selenocysteine lyase/cysteine desulfurase